jgi:hypothetical protein
VRFNGRFFDRICLDDVSERKQRGPEYVIRFVDWQPGNRSINVAACPVGCDHAAQYFGHTAVVPIVVSVVCAVQSGQGAACLTVRELLCFGRRGLGWWWRLVIARAHMANVEQAALTAAVHDQPVGGTIPGALCFGGLPCAHGLGFGGG